MSKKNLPTIAELVDTDNLEEAYKHDQFKILTSQQPPKKWVKEHPYIKGHRYLPIDKVEHLLKGIFDDYRIEWKDTKLMMNSVFTSVRVHVKNRLTGEWSYHDGVGSAELQTQKDTGPLRADMSNVKNGAVPMATGISKSVAIKDACDHFGDLFGANLNRKDTLQYTGDKGIEEKMLERVNAVLDKCETIEDVEEAKKSIPQPYHELSDQLIDYMKTKEEEDEV